MIVLVHLLVGAALGSYFKNPVLAIILAFFSHYLLDFIPHIDYRINNIMRGKWPDSLSDFLKISCDTALGLCIIFLTSANKPIVYLCSFFTMIPDVIAYIGVIWPNKFSNWHNGFNDKVHYYKYKKIPVPWRVLSQITIIVVSIAILI